MDVPHTGTNFLDHERTNIESEENSNEGDSCEGNTHSGDSGRICLRIGVESIVSPAHLGGGFKDLVWNSGRLSRCYPVFQQSETICYASLFIYS
jgi:hypothetical protein